MLEQLIKVSKKAGEIILAIYHEPTYDITKKQDGSLLTQADMASHHFICESLQQFYPDIPIISEESTQHYPFHIRKDWEYFFLVDPLDGTKEFIKRNGEFTVNIALIKKHKPILGVIHAPVLDITYYAEEKKGAYKMVGDKIMPLFSQSRINHELRVIVSRSHACVKTEEFVKTLASQGNEITLVNKGSSLKFGLIAEGSADIYPRVAPTQEWDTAAGQIIVNEIGKRVTVLGSQEELQYNKQELQNPSFVVQ